jgi:excisionase family DNA binding protein
VINGRGPIYTVEEVSDLLGIPRPTLYRYLREYSIPHLRRSGRISIPEESLGRIREARDLHREGLGTGSVRRLLREGGAPNTGELRERLDQLSENLERLRGNERPVAGEVFSSHALRTILARQNLLISAMFDVTEMVEELLLASGKPRKAVFDDVQDEIQDVTPPLERTRRQQLEAPEEDRAATQGVLSGRMDLLIPARRAKFGSLSRRRRRGVLMLLSALLGVFLLTWALPTMASELASGLPLFDGRKVEGSSPSAPDGAATKDQGAGENLPPGSQTPGPGSSASRAAGQLEVPDVSDQRVIRAARILSRAGFEVVTAKIVTNRKEAGTVIRTKPSAGSTVERGTQVVLIVSGGPIGIPPGARSGGAEKGPTARYTTNPE